MGYVSVDAFETTISQISVFWAPFTTSPEMGDSMLLTYNLQWDRGTNEANWVDLIGNPTNSMLSLFIVTNDVLGG
jgi:hypothetical protein